MSENTDYKKQARTRFFCVLRIIDNRIQALAPVDPDDESSPVDWTDLGGETALWTDREEAFQTGRANGGLLVSADGIPGPHRMVAFHARLKALRDEAAPPAKPEEPAAPQFPNAPDRSKPRKPATGKEGTSNGEGTDPLPY